VRVVADTNVLISALFFGGSSEQVFLAGLRRDIQFLTSFPLLKELERVLRGKFKLSAHLIRGILEEIKSVSEIIEVSSHISVLSYPDDDNRVLECAIDGRAEFIITGDTRHLLPLKEFQGIKIISPLEFVKRFISVSP
jgi:putative PIN family toxin of toxin-antitoxin system